MKVLMGWGLMLLFAVALGVGFLFISPIITIALAIVAALSLCVASEWGLLTPTRFYVCGIINQGVGFYWLPQVLSTFGDFSIGTAWILGIALFALQALRYLLLGFLYRLLNHKLRVAPSVSLPIAWTVSELVSPAFMPWYFGNLLWDITPFRYAASLLGVCGVSFLFLWSIHSLFVLIRFVVTNSKARCELPVFSLLVILGVCVWAPRYEFAYQQAIEEAPVLKVGLIQPSLDPLRDFRADKVRDNINKYRLLTAELLRNKIPDVIIWAESSVGLTYYDNQARITRGTEYDPMPGLPTPLIFGGQAVAGKLDGKPAYYTSIFVMETNGRISSVYHKQKLLPISEKPIPGSRLFIDRPFAIRAGESQNPLHWIRNGRAFSAAAVICFEDLWSSVFRSILKDNTDFLLVVTNDNWFLKSAAAMQHAYLARWRAVEFGKPLVRAANDGLTLVVNSLGESILELQPFVPRTGVASVPLVQYPTLYFAYGDMTIWLVLGVVLIASLFAVSTSDCCNTNI